MATDDNDDILIPRRFHSAANRRDASGKTADFLIDPAMLERRRERKNSIPPQPSPGSIDEAPWKHIDRGWLRGFSCLQGPDVDPGRCRAMGGELVHQRGDPNGPTA